MSFKFVRNILINFLELIHDYVLTGAWYAIMML